MSRYPTPTNPGWYWAKLVHPSRMPEGEDWKSSGWEIVQVNDNNGEGDEALSVSVTGISPAQWVPDFVWGPEVPVFEPVVHKAKVGLWPPLSGQTNRPAPPGSTPR